MRVIWWINALPLSYARLTETLGARCVPEAIQLRHSFVWARILRGWLSKPCSQLLQCFENHDVGQVAHQIVFARGRDELMSAQMPIRRILNGLYRQRSKVATKNVSVWRRRSFVRAMSRLRCL